jgi:hypothetical protein
MTPLERLAHTRSQMAQALRDPVWLMLLRRWLKEQPPA